MTKNQIAAAIRAIADEARWQMIYSGPPALVICRVEPLPRNRSLRVMGPPYGPYRDGWPA